MKINNKYDNVMTAKELLKVSLLFMLFLIVLFFFYGCSSCKSPTEPNGMSEPVYLQCLQNEALIRQQIIANIEESRQREADRQERFYLLQHELMLRRIYYGY
jgi:hypothetical protein